MVPLYEKTVQKLSSTEENGKGHITNSRPQEDLCNGWIHEQKHCNGQI
jgi:hypothetical protein